MVGCRFDAGGGGRPVIGKELMPRLVHAGRIGQIPVVHVGDEPLVGAEITRDQVLIGALVCLGGVGRRSGVGRCHVVGPSSG
jgi:hypothetical protein